MGEKVSFNIVEIREGGLLLLSDQFPAFSDAEVILPVSWGETLRLRLSDLSRSDELNVFDKLGEKVGEIDAAGGRFFTPDTDSITWWINQRSHYLGE